MKIRELIGRVAVRTRARRYSAYPSLGAVGVSTTQDDRSFMTTPVLLAGIENNVIYYRDLLEGPLRILAGDFDDGAWEPVTKAYLSGTIWADRDPPYDHDRSAIKDNLLRKDA